MAEGTIPKLVFYLLCFPNSPQRDHSANLFANGCKILLHRHGWKWLALDSAVAAAIFHEDWGMCLE